MRPPAEAQVKAPIAVSGIRVLEFELAVVWHRREHQRNNPGCQRVERGIEREHLEHVRVRLEGEYRAGGTNRERDGQRRVAGVGADVDGHIAFTQKGSQRVNAVLRHALWRFARVQPSRESHVAVGRQRERQDFGSVLARRRPEAKRARQVLQLHGRMVSDQPIEARVLR